MAATRSPIPRWAADLALGARLTLAGGRHGRLRTALTALGVGLGVALLLTAASLPHILQTQHDRTAARHYTFSGSGGVPRADTMLISQVDTTFRDQQITGFTVQPEGPRAPIPPGVAALPGPGQLVVSPTLARLLASPAGALLRPRLDHPIIGTIGRAGLSGPNEYVFYLGSDRLSAGVLVPGAVDRIDHFGDRRPSGGLAPRLVVLVVIALVVLLLPVVVFIAAAARFGGEHRDRRLAALRLVGADRRMATRIAAGEALLGSVFGLAVGVLILLVARQLVVPRLSFWGVSLYPSDVWPDPAFAVLILLGVPASAVAASLFALRHVVIEPLGVVRRAGVARRRVWWRLVLPLIGLALLYPMFGMAHATRPHEYQLIAGAVLLLIGVLSLLPWLIDAVVRRAGGATVSWQLAVRRLQQAGTTSTRAAGGVAVAVAGGIALQMIFTGVQVADSHPTGEDPSRAQAVAVLDNGFVDGAAADQITAKFRGTPGVFAAHALVSASIRWGGPSGPGATGDADGPAGGISVGDCATLAEVAGIHRCADGDVFIAQWPAGPVSEGSLPTPGQRVTLVSGNGHSGPQWTIPRTARSITATTDPDGVVLGGLLATPGAIAAAELRDPSIELYLRTDGRPDGIEYIRNTAAAVSPVMKVYPLRTTDEDAAFADIRRGLLIGVLAALLLIGASLLVGMLEQLREQRRTLAVLVAFGARRGTLSASVLWQAAIPIVLGLVLAGIFGTGLGMALQAITRLPVRLDWAGVGAMSGAAALVVLLVTALSLPALWRLLRPDGLRTE